MGKENGGFYDNEHQRKILDIIKRKESVLTKEEVAILLAKPKRLPNA